MDQRSFGKKIAGYFSNLPSVYLACYKNRISAGVYFSSFEWQEIPATLILDTVIL